MSCIVGVCPDTRTLKHALHGSTDFSISWGMSRIQGSGNIMSHWHVFALRCVDAGTEKPPWLQLSVQQIFVM